MKYLVGLDLGTSGVKAVLFDTKGKIIGDFTKPYNLYVERDNYAEQDALEWKEATLSAIKCLLDNDKINNNDIIGLGVSGQMHGLVLLDKDKEPLRKVIIWCDNRATKETKTLTALVGEEKLIETTGNLALSALTASKLLWIKENEPKLFSDIRHVMLPKDYINFVLTGELRSEPSDASGTQFFDINKREWSQAIIDKIGLPLSTFNKIINSDEVVGHVTSKVSKLTGLPSTCVVCAGASDQSAAALGNGVIKTGQSSCSLGTSGVLFIPINKPLHVKGSALQTFCHCVKDTWTLMAVTQGCGISLTWLKDNYYKEDSFMVMDEDAGGVTIGANKTIFLPYLLGERSPILDPDARGTLIGIKTNTDRRVIARSVMEGIAYSLYHSFEYARESNTKLQEILLAGGGSHSRTLVGALTDLFNTPTVKTNTSESGALGAVLLASVAAGYYTSVEEAVKHMTSYSSRELPNINNHKKYLKYYELYKELYLANKNIYQKLKDSDYE